MDRSRLTELHYLTPIDNLRSIQARGVLSHELAARVPHVDASDAEVQDTRRNKRVAFAGQARARKLHSYANLFIHGRNSMLSALCHRRGHDAIVVVRIGAEVLDLPDVVIADQNAASRYARFYASPGGLAHLGENYVFARDWGDPAVDQIDYWRRKSQRSAEVLVPDRVEPDFVRGVYVSGQRAQKQCRALDLLLDISVDPDLFFLA